MEPVQSNIHYSPPTHEDVPSTPVKASAPPVQEPAKCVATDEYNEIPRPGTLNFYELPKKLKNLEYSENDCKCLIV